MQSTSRVDLQQTWLRRMNWLRAWLAVSCLALVASTWKLWTPQTVFPQIPFLAALRTAPAWLDWIALTLLLIALVAMLANSLIHRRPPASAGGDECRDLPTFADAAPSPKREGCRSFSWLRAASILFVASLALLILLDQHRFQPWAYQVAIVAIVLAFTPPERAASLLRVLTIGIYFWSAVSKFDYTFLHGLGPELLRGMLAAFRLEPGWIRPEVATLLAWAFPLDELAVAILLAIRKTRTIGLVAAIAMHVLLLATLGPLGLDHSPGVLIWNLYFIGQDLLLFRRAANRGSPTLQPMRLAPVGSLVQRLGARPTTASISYTVVLAGVTLPALEPFGLLDHWPGWAVYSPSAERINATLFNWNERPPEELKDYFAVWRGDSFSSGSRLDLWSLDALSVPLYPQNRFSTGVAIAVIERYGLEETVWMRVDSRANRFTGERSDRTYVGEDGIREYAFSFYLNALPRKLGGW